MAAKYDNASETMSNNAALLLQLLYRINDAWRQDWRLNTRLRCLF